VIGNLDQARKWGQLFLTVVLTFILGLAAYLRLAGLGTESLWLDEGYTVAFTGLPFGKMMAYIATRDVHPPLYYILIKIWRYLGDSEAFLRFPSVVFGIAAVAYMWAMVEEHWGAAAAAASSLLLATSAMAIYYSQEARMYSLLLLLTVLSLRCFLRFVSLFRFAGEDGQGNSFPRATARDCAGLTVFTLALLYTHNVAVFLWGAQLFAGGALGLQLFVRSRRKRSGGDIVGPGFLHGSFRQWLICQAVIGVLYLPWLLVLFGQSANVHSRFWLERPNLDTVWTILGAALAWGAWSVPIVWNTTKLIVLIVAVKMVLNLRDVKGLVLGTCVALPLLMSYLYSIFRTPIMLDRTLIFLSIPLLALIGSFETIPGAKARTASKILIALQVLAGAAVFTFLVYINMNSWRMEQGGQSKDDFRAAASITARFANESTAVVFNNAASQAPFDYYFHRFDEGRKIDEYGVPCNYLETREGSSSMEPLVTPESIRALDRKLSAYRRVALVRSNQQYTDPSGLLKEYFDSHWRFGQQFSVKRVEITIYNRD
jgi:uncharacterized membrane protein